MDFHRQRFFRFLLSSPIVFLTNFIIGRCLLLYLLCLDMPLFQEASWSIEAASSSYGFITHGKPPAESFYAMVLLFTNSHRDCMSLAVTRVLTRQKFSLFWECFEDLFSSSDDAGGQAGPALQVGDNSMVS